MEWNTSLKNRLPLAFIPAMSLLFWLNSTPKATADSDSARNKALQTAGRMVDAPAALAPVPSPGPLQAIPTNRLPMNGISQISSQIETKELESLAVAGCGVNAKSDSEVPYADPLDLPPGPYPKAYQATGKTRIFSIVGNDCDHIANGPSIRMVVMHQTKPGEAYIALLSTKGDPMGFLYEPFYLKYVRMDKRQLEYWDCSSGKCLKLPINKQIETMARKVNLDEINVDLKSEVDGWNKALIKRLQTQVRAGDAPNPQLASRQ